MAKVARLLDTIVPERYALDIDVDMAGSRFAIHESIDFAVVEPSNELVFHAVGLEVSEVKLDGKLSPESVKLDEKTETVTFAFAEIVGAGMHHLSMRVRGVIGDSLHGFYRSTYQRDGQEQLIATTQFEAVHAREALVAIDEPSAKAVFELNLTVPEGMMALSNTVATEETPAGEGRKRVTFAPTPKMSTYLLAYVVGEFEYLEGETAEGVRVRALATPGHKDQLAFALDMATWTLSFFGDYFGIPYPLPNLDMVALPDFAAGAMENWGLVTYRETALLLDPERTSLMAKQRVAEIVTHELAHQWFGNLVTMRWWNDLWLNEGFATWCADLARNARFPEWEIWAHFTADETGRAMELDSLVSTHPIEVEVEDPRGLDEIFDAVSYSKGGSVIRMLHHYLGDQDFRKGLHAYLTKHSYANAVTHDLWRALEAASGKPVDALMSAWTSKPGYPVVTFDDGEVQQRRFYSSPRQAAKGQDASLWPIPFNVLLPGGRETPTELLRKHSDMLSAEILGSDWFKPNPGQTGFFRTHYTEGMIEALTAPLHTRELAVVDRFGIIGDVTAATEAGVTTSTALLKLVAALRDEPNYVVWTGVSGALGDLSHAVEDAALRERLDHFGHWLVGPNVKRLGWEAADDESSFDTLMRPLVLQQAIRFDDETVVKEAKTRWAAWMDGAETDPDVVAALLFAAARHGGEHEFEAMQSRYEREPVPQIKLGLLGAMGRFRQPALIARYLAYALTEAVRPQDLYIALAWGMRNRDGRDATWQWVQDHWNLWLERYGAGGHMLEHFPLFVGAGFATHAKAAEIRDFFDSHPHPALGRPTDQAVESVELRADWADRDAAAVAAFLADWEQAQAR
ncbi:MAG TPA: M1 family metallopeptidase [Candidatus Saccharimonadia bacterium]|nr:M1 family metallopeptidase [Candidatus Saccharimonadia bacterium]